MSCPDWRTAVAARERDPFGDPPGWSEVRSHLSSCSSCRREALAVDPLLLFQRLTTPAVSDAEIASMQQGVAALIRAGRVGRQSGGRRALAVRVAAAAALVAAVLTVQPTRVPEGAVSADREAWAAVSASLPVQPLIDEVDSEQARVYELSSDGVAVVMVVDANLNV